MLNSQTSKNYKKAIQIVARIQSNPSQFDFSSFLMGLIRNYPGEFVETYREITDILRHRVLTELRSNHKIMAIKIYRDCTEVSLKDAKEAVEKIIKEEGLQDMYNFSGATTGRFSSSTPNISEAPKNGYNETWHICREGKIRPYPAVSCSSCLLSDKTRHFNPLTELKTKDEQIKELERKSIRFSKHITAAGRFLRKHGLMEEFEQALKGKFNG